MRIALPLAGSGVRGIRFAKELDKGIAETIDMNDLSETAVIGILENLRRNKVEMAVHNKDANLFLLESSGFDYIDIDPFGTPNPFLDSAVKRISRASASALESFWGTNKPSV